jgi:hypothetical protein
MNNMRRAPHRIDLNAIRMRSARITPPSRRNLEQIGKICQSPCAGYHAASTGQKTYDGVVMNSPFFR